MILRFSLAGRRPSASAMLQPPAYHAQFTPFADNVSPIVLAVCGGRGSLHAGVPLGSARSRLPSGAGGMPLGWEGGCVVPADPAAVDLHCSILGRSRTRPLGQFSV